ncbi:Long-chain-fatty-acid--CoA ligase ACSBG2, partial [Galemys pyrenaicus]
TPGLWTIHRDGEVLLRLSKHGPGHETPVTVPELFLQSVKRFGAFPALATKKSGKWDVLSFSQYYEACRKAARALIKLGLQRFHGVGILGFNSKEWLIAYLGAILAGGISVGIYATNSADACQYVITQSKVDILLVENDLQLRKILSIEHMMQTLKAVIQYKNPLNENMMNLYNWEDFMELGNSIPDFRLDQIIESQKANQCAVIIYTSGIGGYPKGVMLSHDNITWMAGAAAKDCCLSYASERQELVVSYLPLSHIATQMMDVWIPMKIGALIYFAQPDALKGTLLGTLQEVKPTAFLGVPRIWEKMEEKLKETNARSSRLRRKVFSWARAVGLKTNTKRMLGRQEVSMSYRVAKTLVFSRVRGCLGLEHCHSCISGAAALSQETAEFFLSLDIPVGEMYGMTESSGPHTVSNKDNYKILSCGKILTGCKNMLYQQTQDGTGEICLWGRHVFMGYLDKEEATKEAIDEEGWLHSGDLGKLDQQGFLFITGRIKGILGLASCKRAEILITADGENVPPVPIENKLKEKIPIISNAMLVGDKAMFLSVLLTLKCETDEASGEPLDRLTSEAIKFCRKLGSQASTVTEVLKLRDPLVHKAIQQGIIAVNQEATAKAQKIHKWTILEKDFSIPGGELGVFEASRVHRPTGRSYWTTRSDGEVRLRHERGSFASRTPLTVHDMVRGTAMQYANYIALGSKHGNTWHLLTYIEYYEQCRRAAKAFLKLGLERFHSVGIMGFNSEEWAISSIGAILAGGFSVGILSTNSPKTCQVIAESSQMDIVVVDNDRQLQKVIQTQGYLKRLKAIIQYKEEIRIRLEKLYSWKGFLDLADSVSDDTLDRVIDSQKPNQCCAVFYKMVTTGPPRAIMISHDNVSPCRGACRITWTTAATAQSLCYKCPPEEQEVLVSYLPLSYMGSQIFDMWISISVAGALYFAQPDALRGSLLDTLREVKPTSFYGVPWVWDWLLDHLKTSQLTATPFRKKIDQWAMQLGLRTARRQILGQMHPQLCLRLFRKLTFRLAKKLTYNQARKFLGLYRCQQLFNMGLGLPGATLNFFLSLNMHILQLYGMSECTGVHTLSTLEDFRLLSCGKALPGTHTKIQRQEQSVGDIHIWGRNVFMGYLNDEKYTQEKISPQGWMHTGDIGLLDIDEFLYILGNVEDIITLSSGEKINPNPIEERVKKYLPIVRHVMVVGQEAPYLCALLTLKCQIDTDTGEPRDALTSEAVAFCRQLKSQSTRLSDIVYDRDPVVMDFIGQGIDAANAEAASDSTKIMKWTLLDMDFSITGGELEANTKLKRAVVAKIYQTEIKSFYCNDEL